MNIEQIYEEVLLIVQKAYAPLYSDVKFNAKNMLQEHMDPKEVQKYEDKQKRDLQIRFNAAIKTALVVEIFVRSNYTYSDKMIAEVIGKAREEHPNIPKLERSSVGRYLIHDSIIELYGIEVYRLILEKRKDNLNAAKSKGGKAFAANNTAIKDELGKFQGSIKK